MKTVAILSAIIFCFGACSSPKKTTVKTSSPKVTKTDRIRGGTSFDNPVDIRVEKESLGLIEEYKWLSNNYPGYGLIRRTQATRSSRHYDIVRIKTKQGQLKDIYFDTTYFFGKL